MPLSTFQIHRLARDLDENATPDDTLAACVVIDITLNRTRDPIKLMVRHRCPYSLVVSYLNNLRKYNMLNHNWWLQENELEAIVEFWLLVFTAQGKLSVKNEKPLSHGG